MEKDVPNQVPADVLKDESASQPLDTENIDGGYGWWVVAGCAVVTWWYVGNGYSWGVLQAELLESGISTASTLSFVGSLTTACISIFGILNGYIIRTLGARFTAVLGITLLGFGQLLSGFSTHQVGGLFATTGVIAGMGTRSRLLLNF